MKFTQINVRNLKCPLGKSDHTEWDENMPGFGIRFRNGGPGTFMVLYSLNGRQTRVPLGKVSQVKLDAAQTEAKQLFALVARKVDPHMERARIDAKAGEGFPVKIEAFLAWQIEKKGRTSAYIAAMRRSLVRYFKELHKFGVGDVTRKLVADQLDSIEENHGTRSAGISRAHLSSYYGYLMTKGYDGFNPVDGTEARSSEQRTRVLTPAELALIWKATERDDDFSIIIRLLMLTAARKTTFGSLKRAEYDAENHVIDLAVGRTKNKTRFLLALSPRAEAILTKVINRRNHDEFVFGDGGEGGFSGWSKAKDALDARIAELNGGEPIEHWVLHDFRRTFNTLGVDKAGIEDMTADICLHHVGEAKKGIKGTYNHAHHLDRKHAAMALWADFIAGCVNPPPKLSVVA